MTTIWDAITAGENEKRQREQQDLQSWLMQQKAAADAEHSRATTRMLDENATTVSWERQQKMQESQDAAYGAIQNALDNGDTQYADYLSRTHLGQALEDITPSDDRTLPLTFGDEGGSPDSAAPAATAQAQQPPEPQGSPRLGELAQQAPQQRMYGPEATPDIMAEAASRDLKRDPGAGREAWMADHPGEAGTPGMADIEQYLRAQAAAKQQAALQAQPAPMPQAPQRAPAPMVPQQAPSQPAPAQATAQAYSPQVQAAAYEPMPRKYRVGDVTFDPGARKEAKVRARKEEERARLAAIDAVRAQDPNLANFLMQANAVRGLGFDVGKAGEKHLESEDTERVNTSKFRDLGRMKLNLEALDHENDMAEIGLKNTGAKDVAGIRAAAKRGGGGGGMLTAPQRKAAMQEMNSEKNSFLKQTNYPKLLDRYQRGQAALDAVNSGNPIGTGLAIEALISSHRGGAATQAFLKQFQENQSSVGGRMESFAEKAASGDYGAEAKANVRRAAEEQLKLLREEANQLKQSWSSNAFAPEKYGMKANYEGLHDELWGPFGFERIKRDPNGGSVQITGQRRPGSAPAAPKTIGEKLVGGGKPKKRAEDMLDELLK